MEKKLMPLSQNENDLIALTAHALFNRPLSLSDTPDWDGIMREARLQAVFQIAFDGHTGLLPLELREKARRQCLSNTVNSARVFSDHGFVHGEMAQSNIPYVILKGCASASYYPQPLKRAMGDVDFLVDKGDLERAGGVLEAAGYKPWDENHICHVVYRRESSHLELHFEPAGVPSGKAGELIRDFLRDITRQRRETSVEGFTMYLPSHFHHGLILLMHTVHHLLSEGVGLRHLCDWAVFVNSLSDEKFTELFEEKLTRAGLWRTAQLLSLVCVKYLGIEKKTCFGTAPDALVDDILLDIMHGGNFGSKDRNRSREGMFISNRGKDGVGRKSPLRQLAENINRIVFTKWPSSQRYRLLLIPGWIFFGGRYLLRVLRGERKMLDLQEAAKGAEQRKTIYRELHLYEMR